MSCLNFEYSLIGQSFLAESGYGSPSRPRPHRSRASHPLHHPPHSSSLSTHSSFLAPFNAFCYDLSYQSHAPSSPSFDDSSSERSLYPIYEEDEEGYEDDNDDDDDDHGAFDAPFLRFFKSCFVQFAYLIPTDKGLKSPPPSPRSREEQQVSR